MKVETPEELATLALNDPVLDFGACPDPSVQFIIAKIRSTETAGLIPRKPLRIQRFKHLLG